MFEEHKLDEKKFKIIIYHGYIHKIPIDDIEMDPIHKSSKNKESLLKS